MGSTLPVTRRIVRIRSGEIELEAAYEAPVAPRGLVIFAHGSGSSRMSPRNRYVAITLRRKGFATLLLDLLTEAEDMRGDHRFDIGLLVERLRSAVRWASSYLPAASLPIGLFGASTGAAAALELAALPEEDIAAVVSRAGRADLASAQCLAEVTAPTLLIVGERDIGVIEINEGAYEKLRCVKSLSIVPGASHLFEEDGALEQVAALAADWFSRHLVGPAAGHAQRLAAHGLA